MYYEGGSGLLPNNSFIYTDSNGRMESLFCLSGSPQAGVGKWLTPAGTDVTLLGGSFEVNIDDPGSIEISIPLTSPPLDETHTGIFTCEIPDETGDTQRLFIGIYFSGSGGTLLILCLNSVLF